MFRSYLFFFNIMLEYNPSKLINKKMMCFSALESTSSYIDNNAHVNRIKLNN